MKKRIFLLFLACSTLFMLAKAQQVPLRLAETFQQEKTVLPAEKIYLQTDRTLFKPSEEIWFNAFVVTPSHLPSAKSKILFVEWIAPNGKIVQRFSLAHKDGHFVGSIPITYNAVGGVYTIKAYTNWSKNFGEIVAFEKKITVQNVVLPRLLMTFDFEKEAYGAGDEVVASLEVRQQNDAPLANYALRYVVEIGGKIFLENEEKTDADGKTDLSFFLPNDLASLDGLVNVLIDFEGSTESIARSIPIVLNNISLQFFPEGGDLLLGMKNRVAFEALNEFGQPADVSGFVFDSKGRVIANFESFHQGMGAFEFEPQLGESYQAQITKPIALTQTFPLPTALPTGIGLFKTNQTKESVAFYMHNPQGQTLHLVAEIGDSIYPIQTVEQAQSGIFQIKTKDFPTGILKLTVFDANLQPQAERLVFVNYHRNLHIDIQTDKEKYLPRDLVNVAILVMDSEGKGVSGNFAMAVVEDKQHTFIDDKQDNILSGLLMSEMLKGEIFEPSFYFNKKEEKAEAALDLVLMTHGWRRFTWKERFANTEMGWAKFVQYAEDVLKIKGIVNIDNMPASGAKVFLENQEATAVKSDKNGNFSINLADFKDFPKYINVKYRGLTHRQAINYQQFIYDEPTTKTENKSVSVKQVKADVGDVKITIEEDNKTLSAKEIEIRGSRISGRVSGIQIIEEVNLNQVSASDLESVVVVGYGAYYNVSSANMSNYSVNFDLEETQPRLYATIASRNNYDTNRQFYAIQYPSQNKRYYHYNSDFRKTLHWSPFVKTDKDGKYKTSFYCSDESTTFRAIVEGISEDGQIGRTEKTFYVQAPISVEVKTPELVATNDIFNSTITIKNNTDAPTTVHLSTKRNTAHYILLSSPDATFEVPANSFITKNIECHAGASATNKYLYFQFKGDMINEEFYKPLKIEAKGFPAHLSFSNNKSQVFSFEMGEAEEGSITARFVAYPSILGELIDGVKSMIREPHGCFSQVSSSNYPNILALEFMEIMKSDDPKTRHTALSYMDLAYDKLTGYECATGGFDWYGRSPGNERLSAYGLLEFMDMKRVYPKVSQSMINRTAEWLYKKRDGKGGFTGGYYGWGDYVTTHNAYITYALAVHNGYDISVELSKVSAEAKISKDWYRLSLAILSNYHIGNTVAAEELLGVLLEELENQGLDAPKVANTMTYSYGLSRNIEALSMVAQAIIKSQKAEHIGILEVLIQKISSYKSGYGYFGSTQGTIQALKALIEYVQFVKPNEDKSGEINVLVNGKQIWRQAYHAKDVQPLGIDFGEYLQIGKNEVAVQFSDNENAIPFTTGIHWSSLTPLSAAECKVKLKTTLSKTTANIGETVRLTTTLTNPHNELLHNPIALIGIPAGLSLQPWQLKELQDKEVIDYYEIQDSYIVLYFRFLKNKEIKTINLDLKADIVGAFQSMANSAYLYYGAEHKDWQQGTEIVILP